MGRCIAEKLREDARPLLRGSTLACCVFLKKQAEEVARVLMISPISIIRYSECYIDPLPSGRGSSIRLVHLTFDLDSCRAKTYSG